MYLLNPFANDKTDDVTVYLHSTMYLLNPPDEIKQLNKFLIYIPLCIY